MLKYLLKVALLALIATSPLLLLVYSLHIEGIL